MPAVCIELTLIDVKVLAAHVLKIHSEKRHCDYSHNILKLSLASREYTSSCESLEKSWSIDPAAVPIARRLQGPNATTPDTEASFTDDIESQAAGSSDALEALDILAELYVRSD